MVSVLSPAHRSKESSRPEQFCGIVHAHFVDLNGVNERANPAAAGALAGLLELDLRDADVSDALLERDLNIQREEFVKFVTAKHGDLA